MARSIVNQGLYLQRETTPGTPATDAMRRYLSIRGRIGWDVNKEYFQAAGYKLTTGENVLTEMGSADLEVTQDYNGMLPMLTGAFGAPVTTALDDDAYQHVFTLDARQADTLVTYTAIWGDPTLALQATAFAFNGFGFEVGRTGLSASTSAILRAPDTSGAVPTTGVTEVPFVPVRASTYDVFMDSSWANLGTTKLLALYRANVDFPDKLEPDWIVNSALPSYSELMEREGYEPTLGMTVGFDATAVGMIDDALQGGMKFIRIAANGPDINGTDNYAFEFDCAAILNPGGVNSAPDSAAVVVEFDGRVQVDGESGQAAAVRLVNTVASV